MRPCPFCGDPKPRCLAHLKSTGWRGTYCWAQVDCKTCQARGPIANITDRNMPASDQRTTAKAIAQAGWNGRTP